MRVPKTRHPLPVKNVAILFLTMLPLLIYARTENKIHRIFLKFHLGVFPS